MKSVKKESVKKNAGKGTRKHKIKIQFSTPEQQEAVKEAKERLELINQRNAFGDKPLRPSERKFNSPVWHENAFGGSENKGVKKIYIYSQCDFVVKQSGSSTTSLKRNMESKHPHIWREIIASDERQPKITTFPKIRFRLVKSI